MNYINHPSNNRSFGAPSGWDHDKIACGALPVTVGEVAGEAVITSFWRPDEVELALINAGKPIMLTVYGRGHPVVSMGVEA